MAKRAEFLVLFLPVIVYAAARRLAAESAARVPGALWVAYVIRQKPKQRTVLSWHMWLTVYTAQPVCRSRTTAQLLASPRAERTVIVRWPANERMYGCRRVLEWNNGRILRRSESIVETQRIVPRLTIPLRQPGSERNKIRVLYAELLSRQLTRGKKLFSERVVKGWNSLPPRVANFSSVMTFRNSLTKFDFKIGAKY